jgi:hypothetical protein
MDKTTDDTLIIRWHPVNEMPPTPIPALWEKRRMELVSNGLWSYLLYDPETNILHRYLLDTWQTEDCI